MKSFRQYLIEILAPTALAKVRSTLPNLYRAHASTEDFIGKGAVSPDTGLHHFSVFHNGGKAIQPREIGTHVSSKTFRDSPYTEGWKRRQTSTRLYNQPDNAQLGLSSSFNMGEADRHSGPDRMITSKLDISVHPDNIRNFKDHSEWANWLETERVTYIKKDPKLSKYFAKLNSRFEYQERAVDQLGPIDNPPYVPGQIISPARTEAYKAAKRIDDNRSREIRDLLHLRDEHHMRIDSAILKQNNIKAITLRRGTGKNRHSGELMVLDPSIVDNTSHAISPSYLKDVASQR